MASTDATFVPVKNQAYRLTFPILDADGDLVTGASSLDSEVSKDGGAFADCTNEATEIATSSGMYYLDLTATEMNADTVAVIVKSTEGKTTPIVLYPQEAGSELKVDVTHISGDSAAADNLEAEYDGTGFKSYLRRNTAQAGAAGSITLDASASATNDLYNGNLVAIVSGTGAGQSRLITDYVGATKVATVSPSWTTNPDATSVFVVLPLGDVLRAVLTEEYAADGATFSVAQALYEIAQSIGEFAISGTTITMKKRDGSTTAGTYVLDSATTPTSRTRAS